MIELRWDVDTNGLQTQIDAWRELIRAWWIGFLCIRC
ncbi:uncharacterized protein METZ01_LOCUS233525 [marine metagenome]|uniref:Uncharacterized protein n=1 Tax=marine metagenome TaxID=408172 RepID=A0A382H2I9_9ZZZZ